MPYSPVKNIDFSKMTTSGVDKGFIDPNTQSAAGVPGIKGAQGAAIAGQVAGVASGLIDTSDALSKNSVGKSAAAKGLEYAAMGAALGPWGALGGLAVGSVVGAVEGNKAKKEALKQVKKNKGIATSAEVDKNKYEMEQYDYSKINPDGTMGIAMTGKPLKMLTGINSPMTYKMSAAQYKSAVKMSEISGASTLPSALTLKGDQYKIDANKDDEITGEDFKLLKNK